MKLMKLLKNKWVIGIAIAIVIVALVWNQGWLDTATEEQHGTGGIPMVTVGQWQRERGGYTDGTRVEVWGVCSNVVPTSHLIEIRDPTGEPYVMTFDIMEHAPTVAVGDSVLVDIIEYRDGYTYRFEVSHYTVMEPPGY